MRWRYNEPTEEILDVDTGAAVGRHEPATGPMAASAPMLADLLEQALSIIEANTCDHSNTERQGTIWEACCDCPARWADDRGGKPPGPPGELAFVAAARAEVKAAGVDGPAPIPPTRLVDIGNGRHILVEGWSMKPAPVDDDPFWF